jgi:phage tail sheath gpL-like
VAASAKLTLSIATVSFPDADPDLVPSISNSEGAVTVTAKGKTTTGSNVTLTLQAAGDLASGSDTIPISNVTWTATGAGYVAGTMSSGSAVSVGSWLNSGNRTGQLSFFLLNSWDYEVGTYSVGATYTLTAP